MLPVTSGRFCGVWHSRPVPWFPEDLDSLGLGHGGIRQSLNALDGAMLRSYRSTEHGWRHPERPLLRSVGRGNLRRLWASNGWALFAGDPTVKRLGSNVWPASKEFLAFRMSRNTWVG